MAVVVPITARTPEAAAVPPYEPPFPPELIEQTARFKRLNRLDEYFKGTQYKGRPDFFGRDGEDVPLLERAPCVIYPLPKACVNQATRFTFGEGRFPTIKVQEIDEAQAVAPGLTLDGGEPRPKRLPGQAPPIGEEAKPPEDEKVDRGEVGVLQGAVNALVEQATLRSTMRTLLRRGLSACASVAVIALRKGRFSIDTPHPKNCIPTFVDPSTCDVQALTICYRFTKEVYNPKTKQLEERQFWYRRDITDSEDIRFADAEIVAGKPVVWRVLQAKKHGLGVCPVIWTPNLREDDGETDGCSLYEGLEKEFDALNFALSQRHRGINYWGVPQPWENLGPGGEPAGGTGRTALIPKDNGGARGYRSTRSARPARRVAPNNIWYLEVEKAQIGLLETTGKAFEAATNHVLDVRARILEAIDVVLMDPATIAGKGDISAKALSYMYAPLLALVDELRECWWTKGLLPILGMMLRIVAVLDGRGIRIPGVEQVASICKRFMLDGEWVPPPLTPVWGDYFSPSNSEITEGVNTAVAAKGVLISEKTAVRYVSSYFGVEDVDEELDELSQQQEAQAQVDHDRAKELIQAKPMGNQGEPMAPKQLKDAR
jgi:hypothetical protein